MATTTKRFKVEPVRPMSFAEFEEIRLELGALSYAEMARALGYADPTQLFRWRKAGPDALIPGPAAKIMRIFRDLGQVY